MPAPLPLPPVPVQIVQTALAQGEGATELQLAPEELGRVRIELRTEGDRVAMLVSAERPETQDLLRRHAEKLATELRAAGFQQVDLGFGSWGQPGERLHRAPPAPAVGPSVPGEMQVSGAAPVPPKPRPTGADSLYVRI